MQIQSYLHDFSKAPELLRLKNENIEILNAQNWHFPSKHLMQYIKWKYVLHKF